MSHLPSTYIIPMAQWVKHLPAVQETQEMWVQSLGLEDPLEEEMTYLLPLFGNPKFTFPFCKIQIFFLICFIF